MKNTPDPKAVLQAVQQIQVVEAELRDRFFEREEVIRLLMTGLVARRHAVLLGPPGTAKSDLVRAIGNAFVDPASNSGLRFFEQLATKQMTPDDLFGPIDLVAYRAGRYERILDGRMAGVELVFFDECFKTSGTSLNMLLALMNEGIYHNGVVPVRAPLMMLVGASNEMPVGEETGAIWDRFFLRVGVEYLKTRWEDMMLLPETAAAPTTVDVADLTLLQNTVELVKVEPAIIKSLAGLKQTLETEGIIASDRRWRQLLRVLRAHALLESRTQVTEDDFEMLKFVLWQQPDDIKAVGKAVSRIGNPMVTQYMDLVDAALTAYQNAIEAQQNATFSDDQKSKALLGCWRRLKDTRKELDGLQQHVGTNKRVKIARPKFDQALEKIVDLVQ